MNILMISASFPPAEGGVATHVLNLVHGLINKFPSNIVEILTAGNSTLTEPKYSHFGKLHKHEYPKDRYGDFFSGRIAPYHPIILYIMKNSKLLKKVDIIHCHDLESAYIGWMLKVAFKKPLIFTLHRAPTPWITNHFRNNTKDCFIEAIRLNNIIDRFIVPSKISKSVLLEQGFNQDTITIIQNGIAYKYLSSIHNDDDLLRTILPNPKVTLILCPSRADEHKDPETFIKMASLLKNQLKHKNLFFILTGNSNKLFNFEHTAKGLGLEINKDIIFRNFRYKEMPTIYRRADVCVVPSIRESFGQTIVESFVFKTPVVASNAGAFPEIITHGRNGLLFTSSSPKDCADCVMDLLEDEELRTAIIYNALADAKAKFDSVRMVNEYFKLYESLK